MKKELASDKVLAFPDFEKEFVVYTDASQYALGAVLQNADGRPVHFASRVLQDAETRYAVIEKELLGMVFATKVFRAYLLGRHFVMRTDHAPLAWMRAMTDPSSRLTKWRLKLEEFDFTVEHVPGRQNGAADALSRKNISMLTWSGDELWWITELRKDLEELSAAYMATTRSKRAQEEKLKGQQTADEETEQLKAPLDGLRLRVTKSDGEPRLSRRFFKINPMLPNKPFPGKGQQVVITRQERAKWPLLCKYMRNSGMTPVVIPDVQHLVTKAEQNAALQEVHSSATGGHPGISRTIHTLRRSYYWPTLNKDAEKWVKNCQDCKVNKNPRQPPIPTTLTDMPGEPFEKIYLDIVGPLDPPSARQHSYILTIKDDFSKFVMAIPLKRKTAQEVAEHFVQKWVLQFGVPKVVTTDQGKEFYGVTEMVMARLGIEARKSTPYHHQTVGSLENTHKSLGAYLRTVIGRNNDWDLWLNYFAFAFNTTVNCATGYTPYELLFGRLARKPTNILSDPRVPPPKSYSEYVRKLEYALQTAYDEVNRTVWKEKLKRVGEQEIREPETNEQVYVRREVRTKLEPMLEGPYRVIEREFPNITVEKHGRRMKIHLDRVVR